MGSGREKLLVEKHIEYIKGVDKKTDVMEFVMTDHIRMNGAYWGLTAMALMGSLEEMDENRVIEWVLRCKHENGGFSGNIGYDPHILYTLSAIQILALYDKLDLIDPDKIASYISSLQQEDGSFSGDEWGEIDTRLEKIDLNRATDFIMSCKNFDGGFGSVPGGESHAGQMFCCVGSLALAGALADADHAERAAWWLAERQGAGGGLNGRPEKREDVCYSWWVLSCLAILDRMHWIDGDKLQHFILDCQDEERGGISDRPDDMVDIFHTFFGIAGLSLLGYEGLKAVDPAYALPVEVVDRVLRKNSQLSTENRVSNKINE